MCEIGHWSHRTLITSDIDHTMCKIGHWSHQTLITPDIDHTACNIGHWPNQTSTTQDNNQCFPACSSSSRGCSSSNGQRPSYIQRPRLSPGALGFTPSSATRKKWELAHTGYIWDPSFSVQETDQERTLYEGGYPKGILPALKGDLKSFRIIWGPSYAQSTIHPHVD